MDTIGTNEVDAIVKGPQGSGNSGENLPLSTSGQGSKVVAKATDKLHQAATALRERTTGDSRFAPIAGNAATALDSAASYVEGASLEQVRADLSDVIRRHPLPALAAGVGIGVLLGRMFKR